MNVQWIVTKSVLSLLNDKEKGNHVTKCQDQQGKPKEVEKPLMCSEMKGRYEDLFMIYEWLNAVLVEFEV
jgi:hypothetical protein